MSQWTLRFALIWALTAGVIGCATPQWSTATPDGIYTDPDGGYSVQVPVGWQWVKQNAKTPLLATRDGPDLQAIRIYFRKHKDAFPNIEKASGPDMMPGDLAELFVADLREERGIGTIDLVENAPADVSGRPGFRVELVWRNEGGLRYQAIVYGCATPRGLYVLAYNAPVLHYYERHVTEFENSVRTFRLPA
jgi:hypothetical protein